jgi:zinc transporter ZupT
VSSGTEPAHAPVWIVLGFISLTAAATVLGGLVVTLRRRWDAALLHYFVALGAGFMLAAAVLQMMPVSATMTSKAPILVLGGYLLIQFVEHTAVRHFHFGEETHPQHGGGVGWSALVGLSIHSFFDGISVASGFLISPKLGLLLFVAIVLHKAPEGFTIASIMLAGGSSRVVAQLSSVAVGAAGILGALAVYPFRDYVGEGLAFSAGVTLYVAASDLIPEVNRTERGRVAMMVFVGVLLYYLTERGIESVGL